MKTSKTALPQVHAMAVILASGLAWAPLTGAESVASSAASTASSTASSASESSKASSNSSKGGATAATGDYRIDALEPAADKPGWVQLALQPTAAQGQADAREPFVMLMPRQTAEQAGLARGDALSARQKPYGVEFSLAQTRQPFFLVLADDWHRELQARPLL